MILQMEREKFRLISGGKDKPLRGAEGLEPIVILESKIKENEIFSKGEVIGLIEQIAKAEGFKIDSLEVTREALNNENQLLVLDVSVKSKQLASSGWSSIKYVYMIKGEHGKGSTTTSVVVRVYNAKNGDTSQGGIVAEYLEGEWKITPGEISPKLELVTRDE